MLTYADVCRLLRLWLRRKLYEEVEEQAFAFSRGLREIVPAGAQFTCFTRVQKYKY